MSRIATPLIKLVVLVAALGAVGAGTAVAAKLITSKQIKNGSVQGKDVKKKTLGVKHLSVKARASLRGQAGAQGEPGQAGTQGIQGERGPSTAYGVRTEAGKAIINDASSLVQSVTVPDGSYTFSAKAVVLNTGAAPASPNCELGVLRGLFFEPLDQVDNVTVTANGTSADTMEVTLMAFAKLDAGPNTVEVRCTPQNNATFNVRDRTLIATQVAEIK